MAKPTSKLSLRQAGRRAMHRRYETAAEAGDADAMLFLATFRAPEDPEAARVWFRRAAEGGNAHAMYIVACTRGRPTPRARGCGSSAPPRPATSTR